MVSKKENPAAMVDERDLISLVIHKDDVYAANAIFGMDDGMMLVTGVDARDEDSAVELVRVLKRLAMGIRADCLMFATDHEAEEQQAMIELLDVLEAEPGPSIDGRFRSWLFRLDRFNNYLSET